MEKQHIYNLFYGMQVLIFMRIDILLSKYRKDWILIVVLAFYKSEFLGKYYRHGTARHVLKIDLDV